LQPRQAARAQLAVVEIAEVGHAELMDAGRFGMGGSIAHPDPAAALAAFLVALDAALDRAAAPAADAGAAATLRELATLVRSLKANAPPRETPPRLPVCRY